MKTNPALKVLGRLFKDTPDKKILSAALGLMSLREDGKLNQSNAADLLLYYFECGRLLELASAIEKIEKEIVRSGTIIRRVYCDLARKLNRCPPLREIRAAVP